MTDTLNKKKMMVFPKEAANEFDSFLRKNMPMETYAELHTHLGKDVKQYRATSIKNDPAIITTEEVEIIAELTGTTMEYVWGMVKQSLKK